MRFSGKTVVVTGGYRGIGLATVELFAREGANVVLNARRQPELDDAVASAQKVAQGGRVIAAQGDVGYRDQVQRMFDIAMENFGRVDYLINNAGISHGMPFLLADDTWWDDHIRINLTSIFYTCQIFGRQMVKQGEGGSIVNLSSIAATQAHRNTVSYDASKGGVEAFTRALALELAPWYIRVNAISPAAVLGNFVKVKPREWIDTKAYEKFDTPLLQQGTPEDCAELMAFLCSDAASFITGQAIYIDGGLSAQARPFAMGPLQLTPHNIAGKGIID
ncbi:SDR family oxidoreductase [Eubacteriales bacterium OttesenSCG-928-A19]|nr:SDR family oxidoreductase [Eubacteriales bacterium OttesenSCG-928-A19]